MIMAGITCVRKAYWWLGKIEDSCQLQLLENFDMIRYFEPVRFAEIIASSLHNFLDASQDGYGQILQARLVDGYRTIHWIMVMAKSRVPTTKLTSLPISELTAAAWSSIYPSSFTYVPLWTKIVLFCEKRSQIYCKMQVRVWRCCKLCSRFNRGVKPMKTKLFTYGGKRNSLFFNQLLYFK